MKLRVARIIDLIWDEIEASDPDMTTEQLLERTRQSAGERLRCEFDSGEVLDAIELMLKEKTK